MTRFLPLRYFLIVAALGIGTLSSALGAGTHIQAPLANPRGLAIDGQIAFLQQPPGTSGTDLYTMNPDGSDMRQLTNFAAMGDSVENPHWSPNGAQITFTLNYSQLWIVNADGSSPHVLYNDTNPNDCGAWEGSFSPNGQQVVFSHCIPLSNPSTPLGNCPSGCYTIARINIDGSGVTALTQESPISYTLDVNPAYSPDGRSIVFDGQDRGGYLQRLYMMNADGSNMHPIIPSNIGGDGFNPQFDNNGANWSPNGQVIVFSTYPNNQDYGANEEIWADFLGAKWLVPLTHNNDSHQLPYSEANHDFSPSWSPLGDAIVFERDNGDFSTSSIVVMNPDGSHMKILRTFVTHRLRGTPINNAMMRRLHGRTHHLFGQPTFQLIGGGASPTWGSAPLAR